MSRPSFSSPRGRAFAAALVITACGMSVCRADGEIAVPKSGWRTGPENAPFTQTVNYPASRVALEAGVPDAAQIRGKIRDAAKSPLTLVVNGNAMPLLVEEDGSFARAYSFSTGSNSVEIRDQDGRRIDRAQFYQTAAGAPQARLRIVLSWNTNGTDLDLHVVTPSGEHAWYGNRVVKGGAIDVDVTTGYGPEIFAAPAPEKGLYQVYVNFYGRGEEQLMTVARLAVISNEGTPDERRQEYEVPMRQPGELTLVRQFVYP